MAKLGFFGKTALVAAALAAGLIQLPSTVRAQPQPIADTSVAALPVSFEEFKSLATELAPKVNLFRDVWTLDPQAEFYGGTSRDYLYWLKGKLRAARTPEDLHTIVADLRSQPVIDVREFILFESDVDVVSKRQLAIQADRYGVKKIDPISAERFDPATPAGQNELNQGFIPAEKIRLSKTGLVTSPAFGDGAREIFTSKLTVHYAPPEKFASTHYARQKLNHPILLALRFIRLLAVDEFKTHGKGYPNLTRMFSRIDPASAQSVRDVVEKTIRDGDLDAYMKEPRFAKWINQAIGKAFRSYTNPTAAYYLMKHFGADRLHSTYQGLEPINQYVFAKHRDPKLIAENYARVGMKEGDVTIPVRRVFPDGRLYHGTRTEEAFRSILFQGILQSEAGVAGSGLYGVAKYNIDFAIQWGRDENRVVSLEIDPEARIVDVTKGKGRELLETYMRLTPNAEYSSFAEAFGIDIILYPYVTEAFVVKNGSVIRSVQGHKRKLMKFSEIREYVRRAADTLTLPDLARLMQVNYLSTQERAIVESEPAVRKLLSRWSDMPWHQLRHDPVVLELKRADIDILDFAFAERAAVEDISRVDLQTLLYEWDRYYTMRDSIKERLEAAMEARVAALYASYTTPQLVELARRQLKANDGDMLLVLLLEIHRRSPESTEQDTLRNLRRAAIGSSARKREIHEALFSLGATTLGADGLESGLVIDLYTKQKNRESAEYSIIAFVRHPETFTDPLAVRYYDWYVDSQRRFNLFMEKMRANVVATMPSHWTPVDDLILKWLKKSTSNSKAISDSKHRSKEYMIWLKRARTIAPERVTPSLLAQLDKMVEVASKDRWSNADELRSFRHALSQWPTEATRAVRTCKDLF